MKNLKIIKRKTSKEKRQKVYYDVEFALLRTLMAREVFILYHDKPVCSGILNCGDPSVKNIRFLP